MAIRINKTTQKYLSDFMVKGERIRKTFNSKIEAQEYEAVARARLHRGESLEDIIGVRTIPLLGDFFDKVIASLWKGKPNEPTAISHCSGFIDYFGAKTPINKLDTSMLYEFKQWCEEQGNAPATIKLKFSTLSRALAFAVECKWLQSKPSIPQIDLDNERNAFFSEEDEASILKHLEEMGEFYFRDFFIWQIDTGMRPSEARHIKPSQIRSDDPVLGYVVDIKKTKNRDKRTVPLTRRAYNCYHNHAHNEYLWGHWTKDKIRLVWDRLRKVMGRKGDKDFIFYLCRHTCGSRLVQRTGNIYLVKDWLGHKRIEQTLRYSKLSPRCLLSGLNALDKDETIEHISSYIA